MGLFLIFQILLSFCLQAEDRPVYLKPNNPAPTGHFDLKMLERRIIGYDQFEWLWVRDEKGNNGWVLKSLVQLPLDYSRQAVLAKGEALYHEPQDYRVPQSQLPQSQVVSLLERKQDWYKILYKGQQGNRTAWVKERTLSPYTKDGGFFFTTTETQLRDKPQMKAKILERLEPGQVIIPLNTKDSWALVAVGKRRGYIPMTHLRSRVDIAIKVRTSKGYFKPHPDLYKDRILEVFTNPLWVGVGPYTLELKQHPDMGSPSVTTLTPWSQLVRQGYSIKKWAKSTVPEWGELWWPESTLESNVELLEGQKNNLTRLEKNKIYQIEKSPVVQDLQFASTPDGIYRSFDGQQWYPLPGFRNGHPIKVAQNGALFVGDQVSFDHGESFQHFIRWDLILDSLPQKELLGKGPIQILNIEPHHNNPQQVTLSLRLGDNKYLQFYTPDLGQNWRLR